MFWPFRRKRTEPLFPVASSPAPKIKIRPGYLLYDEPLPPRVFQIIRDMAKNYPFMIEVTHWPDPAAMDALFTDRTWTKHGEGCMGEPYSQTMPGVPAGYVAKHFGTDDRSGFLCLPDRDAYDRTIAAFPELVVNARPFRTVVATPDQPLTPFG